MKRLAIVLSIIILLATISPGFSILAQPTHTPHENPAATKSSSDLAALLLSYSKTFDLIATRQYQDAQSVLNELEQANIPDELRYIIDRYNTLTQELLTTLDNLESLLDEASILLSCNQISDAKEKLDEAEAITYDTQFLLKDIEAATNTLGDRLGVPAAPATSQIRQAYDHLEQSLHPPRQLSNELNQLQQSLADRRQTQTIELMPTELSLSISPASAFVGNSITASGRLTSDGNPLANRKLTLFLDSEPLVTTTDLDGSYATKITIPYEYVSTMTLNAVYVPSGDDDVDTYLASKSSPVVVNTMSHSTLLEVSAPETAHPGLPITISGQVSSTGDNIERTIKVLWDNTQLAEETIQGQFSLEITPPPQTSTEEHSLTVVATPQGRYSGTSKKLGIDISRLSIQTDIQVPQFIIMLEPIQIRGKVSHNLAPVQDARVSLAFRQSSTTAKTATDGSFTATMRLPRLSVPTSVSANPFFATTTTVELPLDLSLVGPQQLTITIEPVEPWYAPFQIERWVFTVNPLNIGLMLVAFLSLGLLVYNQVRTRVPKIRKEKVIPQPQVRELPAVTPTVEHKHKFTGIKGRILSAYISGLEAVEKITSISMTAHVTLREFLKTTTPWLPTAIKPFSELTTIAEVALYSAHRLDEDIAIRAEQLATTVKEELHSEAT